MIESFKIEREDIKLDIKDERECWIAIASHPQSNEQTGFIRLQKNRGVLELCNHKAQLSRKWLEMGATSKRYSKKLAGTHGEGFKVASLVMVRKGYQVRYESQNYYWNMLFGGHEKRLLYCHLNPMKETVVTKRKLKDRKRIAQARPRGEVSNIWEDVTVKIGKVYGAQGIPIEWNTFQEWIKICLPISLPKAVTKTDHGDLILDPAFAGRLYIKGLYVDGSACFRTFKFAYNLYEGEMNRDRQSLLDPNKEASMFARIWEDCIEKQVTGACQEYTDMLRNDGNQSFADVHLAGEYLAEATTVSIWENIQHSDVDNNVFYYGEKDAGEVCHVSQTVETTANHLIVHPDH